MFDFLRRKSSKDRFKEMTIELNKDRHYIIIVPSDTNPDELMKTGFFDEYSVFIIQADKLTIMEIE